MGEVTVPLKRAASLRRPQVVVTDRNVELRAPSTLEKPLVVPRADVAGVWPEPDPTAEIWDKALDTLPFWTFHGVGVDRPDFGLVLRRDVEPPPVKRLYRRDLLHERVRLVLFAVQDHAAAVEAFRRAGLRVLDTPFVEF